MMVVTVQPTLKVQGFIYPSASKGIPVGKIVKSLKYLLDQKIPLGQAMVATNALHFPLL